MQNPLGCGAIKEWAALGRGPINTSHNTAATRRSKAFNLLPTPCRVLIFVSCAPLCYFATLHSFCSPSLSAVTSQQHTPPDPVKLSQDNEMVRERIPARSRQNAQLGESWVVESESDSVSDGDDGNSPAASIATAGQAEKVKRSQFKAEPPEKPRRRSTRPSKKASAEPELIMPSIHEGSAGGSSLGEDKRKVEREPNQASRSAKIWEATIKFVTPMISWAFDVLGGALHMLKTPISWILAIWLLAGLLSILRNLVFSSVYSALSPICRMPGSSFLNLPMCQSPISVQYDGDEPPLVQFDELMTVQNKFEAVLQESAGGVSLPLDMKRGETSIRDLRQVVRFSQLRSKNELVLEFDGFIDTARIASYDLQKFNSHIGRSVDNILATARWTKRVLGGIAERDASQGAISWFIKDRVLAPFQPIKFTEDALLDQYIQHTRVVEDEINRLVTEAQAVLMVLNNLEDRLDVIHGIAVRDNLHAQGSKNEVLSQLWTMLGGNRNKLGKFDSQLRLLNQVNTYRQNAIAHVSGTIVRLQSIGAELEELRDRVGGVELLGGKGAVPLSVHLENIEMGVERLERERKGAKELENEELRKSLERSQGSERMIEG
ncbi:hypothetical protein ABVK25_008137 [Lepraria finkii]|uniref:Uncharacterized protein n=1 Tax=Lepraria finkii TaxID=1340010 RepID=A0ABR4B165_9LECA